MSDDYGICQECNADLTADDDRVFCPKCGWEASWKMKIPKEVKCPICGHTMSKLGALGPKGVSGPKNMKGPVDNPLIVGPFMVQTFMCEKCLNLQQFLDETRIEGYES